MDCSFSGPVVNTTSAFMSLRKLFYLCFMSVFYVSPNASFVLELNDNVSVTYLPV